MYVKTIFRYICKNLLEYNRIRCIIVLKTLCTPISSGEFGCFVTVIS